MRTRPTNANQIAAHLGVHYKATVWHLDVLRKYSRVEPYRHGNALQYHLNGWLERHFQIFEYVVNRLASDMKRV